MARPKGQQKLGGRTKGQTNRAKAAFRERLQAYATRHKVDPHYFLVRCLADTTTQVVGVTEAGDSLTAPTVSVALKIQCAKELAQYLQPKLRSVELTGNAETPIEHLHRLPQADLDALITRLLRQTGYAGGHAALPDREERRGDAPRRGDAETGADPPLAVSPCPRVPASPSPQPDGEAP